MAQLRLAYVNLKVVSRRTKPLSPNSAHSAQKRLPYSAIALKAQELFDRNSGAAAVIEELIDDLLEKLDGGRA